MERWIGGKATLGQQSTYRKYSSLIQTSPISPDEKVLKIIEAECDKSFGRELDGIIILTSNNFYFLSKKEVITIPYSKINDIKVKTDGKDKHEYKLTLRVGLSKKNFDDIKKNDDADELFEILEAKTINPKLEILTTVTHNFETFLHAEKLETLRRDNVKVTAFLMKRDDMGLSKNGERLLREKHPKALYVGEGFFKNKENKKQGNFIVVDKTIWLYEYDNKKREAKKILFWPLTFLSGAVVDHFAIKTEIALPEKEKLTLNSGGKKFTEVLETEKIEFKVKSRKWHQKILGFRTGKAWKKTIASLIYANVLLIVLISIFAEDPETVSTTTQIASETETTEQEKEEKTNLAVEDNKQKEEEEAKRLAEEEKKKQEEEAQRLAEEKKKQEEEAARLAAEEEERKRQEAEAQAKAEEERKRKEAEAQAKAEEERKRKEAEAQAAAEEERKRKEAEAKAEADKQTSVYYKNCTAVREAGAAPILKGQPGYAKHLDRDGDGIACDQ